MEFSRGSGPRTVSYYERMVYLPVNTSPATGSDSMYYLCPPIVDPTQNDIFSDVICRLCTI